MRIISGTLKGKNILRPKDKKTRPLRDLVKESIFNLLKHSNKTKFEIHNSDILDLFSGSGSFGLECISRGAHNVFFVENYPLILEILRKNISLLNVNKFSNVFEKNCFELFKIEKIINTKFDLIFIDPPYKENKINFIVEKIKETKILKENGIIILHRHKKDSCELNKNLNILDERTYGISKITIAN
tara:strand:- start:3293 stop:3853 length:561 start_codon:yes stop_codon:yes gene_type:complete